MLDRDKSYPALGQPFTQMDVSRVPKRVESPAARLRGALGAEGPAANQMGVVKFKKLCEGNRALASVRLSVGVTVAEAMRCTHHSS